MSTPTKAPAPTKAAAPTAVQAPARPAESKYQKADPASVAQIKAMARPLSAQELAILSAKTLPGSIDYSPYVTLVRDQVGSSCCIFSGAALMDILKERERAYTPDVSAGMIGYAYQVSIGWFPADPRITIPADGQAGVLKHLGACSESALSSRNADPANPAPPPAAAEIPSDDCINDAPLLRIQDHRVVTLKKSDGLSPLKALLSGGPVGVLHDDHCMALIGYDDATAQFTFQNSWGEHGASRGFVTWTYADTENRLENMSITVLENAPTTPAAYPYVARLRLRTPHGRDNLTISLGVEGQPVSTVWAPPANGFSDMGDALTIDVPLPGYAASHWPPSQGNQWYVEVRYQGQPDGVVEDAVLVKRAFQADRTPLPMLYRSSSTNFKVSPNRPERVFIPARQRINLTLARDALTVPAGQAVTFGGSYFEELAASSTRVLAKPVANQAVRIHQVSSDPIEGAVLGSVVATATTDASGRYRVSYVPSATANYQAIASDGAGTVRATSAVVKVDVQ